MRPGKKFPGRIVDESVLSTDEKRGFQNRGIINEMSPGSPPLFPKRVWYRANRGDKTNDGFVSNRIMHSIHRNRPKTNVSHPPPTHRFRQHWRTRRITAVSCRRNNARNIFYGDFGALNPNRNFHGSTKAISRNVLNTFGTRDRRVCAALIVARKSFFALSVAAHSRQSI